MSSPHAPRALRDAAAAGEAHLGSWWSTFWDWLKGVVATVTHVIVSVAEDVYVGVRVIVDGIAHVFQQIVRVIEDVASAIASFFVKLAKVLADVIEALSVVFHFDEVVKTQQFLLKELNDRLFGIPGNPAYPVLGAAIKGTAIPKLDGFFERGEKAIAGSLNTLADRIAGTNVDQLQGQGATAHTVYTLKPKAGGQAASHAARCSWALQKLKAGAPAPGGGGGPGQLSGSGATGSGPLENFVGDFISRLDHDPTLSGQWEKVRQGFQTMGHAASASVFLSQGVAELLRVLALLLDGVLAVSNAFLDGFLGLLDALITTLFDPHSGWLTRPLDIPVLSWLYHKLLGQPLTILNAIALVAAIPVTVVWRVVEGEWPSQSLASAGATQLGAPRVVVKTMTVFNGIIRIVNGLVAELHDYFSTYPGPPKNIMVILGSLRVYCGMAVGLSSFPLLRGTGAPSDLAWAGWGAALGTVMVGLTGFIVSFAVPAIKYVASGVSFLLGVAGTAITIAAFLTESKQRPVDDVGLAAGLAAAFASIVNPVKFVPEYGGLFVAIMDVLLGLVSATLTFAVAAELP